MWKNELPTFAVLRCGQDGGSCTGLCTIIGSQSPLESRYTPQEMVSFSEGVMHVYPQCGERDSGCGQPGELCTGVEAE